MDIKVISNKEDTQLSIIGFFTLGEIKVSSVDDLVNKVSQKLGAERLRRLDIIAHGSSNTAYIGETEISTTPREDRNEPLKIFGKLKPFFAENGFIVLNICQLGQASGFIVAMAQLTGVPVYANTGDIHHNLGNFGRMGVEVKGLPTGKFESGVKYADVKDIKELPMGTEPMSPSFDF